MTLLAAAALDVDNLQVYLLTRQRLSKKEKSFINGSMVQDDVALRVHLSVFKYGLSSYY